MNLWLALATYYTLLHITSYSLCKVVELYKIQYKSSHHHAAMINACCWKWHAKLHTSIPHTSRDMAHPKYKYTSTLCPTSCSVSLSVYPKTWTSNTSEIATQMRWLYLHWAKMEVSFKIHLSPPSSSKSLWLRLAVCGIRSIMELDVHDCNGKIDVMFLMWCWMNTVL